MSPERIAKLMARRGLCSRREAEKLIEAGLVLVEGRVVQGQGQKAPADAVITLVESGAAALSSLLTVALHKPVGVVSTRPEPGQTPAWKLLRADSIEGEIEAEVLRRVLQDPRSLSVAGRLDRASRGLLILTEDGAVARGIIGGNRVEKTYLVRVSGEARDAQIRKLCGPLALDGRPLLPMRVERVAADRLRFVLVEGRRHQIRRVCRKVGLEVVDLLRQAIGDLRLGSLPEGHWRLLRPPEVEPFRRAGAAGRE
jgi:23S rRNA pseudouridine2604 synthase